MLSCDLRTTGNKQATAKAAGSPETARSNALLLPEGNCKRDTLQPKGFMPWQHAKKLCAGCRVSLSSTAVIDGMSLLSRIPAFDQPQHRQHKLSMLQMTTREASEGITASIALHLSIKQYMWVAAWQLQPTTAVKGIGFFDQSHAPTKRLASNAIAQIKAGTGYANGAVAAAYSTRNNLPLQESTVVPGEAALQCLLTHPNPQNTILQLKQSFSKPAIQQPKAAPPRGTPNQPACQKWQAAWMPPLPTLCMHVLLCATTDLAPAYWYTCPASLVEGHSSTCLLCYAAPSKSLQCSSLSGSLCARPPACLQ
jgi:hypothetical protein